MPSKRSEVKKLEPYGGFFKVGDIVVIGHNALPENAYAGFLAKIEYCNRCCKDYRLQMLDWANNVNFSAADLSKVYKIKL